MDRDSLLAFLTKAAPNVICSHEKIKRVIKDFRGVGRASDTKLMVINACLSICPSLRLLHTHLE